MILSTLVTTSSAGIAAVAAVAKARAEMAAVKRMLVVEEDMKDLEEGSWFCEEVRDLERLDEESRIMAGMEWDFIITRQSPSFGILSFDSVLDPYWSCDQTSSQLLSSTSFSHCIPNIPPGCTMIPKRKPSETIKICEKDEDDSSTQMDC